MHCRKGVRILPIGPSFYRFRYRDNRCGRKESSDAVPTATWSDANAAQRRISAMSVGARYNWPTAGVCAAFHPRIDFTPSLCPSSTPPLCNNNHQPTNQPTYLPYPILSSPLPLASQRNFSLYPTCFSISLERTVARVHIRCSLTLAHTLRAHEAHERAGTKNERGTNERASGSGWGGRGDTQRKVTRFTGNARKPREREEGRREEREEGRESSGDG